MVTIAKKIHYILWRIHPESGKYPVYLCNKKHIPGNGETVVSDRSMAHGVTCKRCLGVLGL